MSRHFTSQEAASTDRLAARLLGEVKEQEPRTRAQMHKAVIGLTRVYGGPVKERAQEAIAAADNGQPIWKVLGDARIILVSNPGA